LTVYLDYNAAAPLRPEARAAMVEALSLTGNPSSVHSGGRAARAVIETSRRAVANLIKAKPASVTFVSGGTEANALAIQSAVASGLERIIVSAIEHPAVMDTALASGVQVEIWPVDAAGVVHLDWLEAQVAAGKPALVCLMLANNETGVVQPVREASQVVRQFNGWLHVDAVQAAGKIDIDFGELGADTLALASQKLGGPAGVGALIAGPRSKLSRLQHGGGQEQGRRAGSENLCGIAGMGAAATASGADPALIRQWTTWRDELESRFERAGAEILGKSAQRLPQTLCLAFPGFAAQLQVMSLDLAGVMVSAGAACSSGKIQASPVIAAMGTPELAACAVRISGGWASTQSDWEQAGNVWLEALERHLELRHPAKEVA